MIGETGGREDAIPVSVLAGSYVIPADVVAALGDGNTLAGMRTMEAMLAQVAGGGVGSGAGQQGPRPFNAVMASIGGAVVGADPRTGLAGDGGVVPILVSDGEYVVSPDQVAGVGGGDIDQGHRALDAFVKNTRAAHVAKLKSLPAPAKG